MEQMGKGDFRSRVIRAARLDVQLYEEVEADAAATRQAMGVVALSSVAAGVGILHLVGPAGILVGTAMGLLGWFLWAAVTFFIGTKLLPVRETHADLGQMLRVIGFASAPGLVRVLGILPLLLPVVFLVANVWMLAAMVVGVRQALDYPTDARGTLRAVAVCALGWLLQFLLFRALLALLGGAPAVG